MQTTPSRLANGRGKFCSRRCARLSGWSVRPDGAHYRSVRIPGHPLADARGIVGEHRVILYEKIGPGEHPCHWCSTTCSWLDPEYTRLVPDHLDGSKRNNDPSNLVPACQSCNVRRERPDRVGDDELYIIVKGGRGRHRAVEKVCTTCGVTFLVVAADRRPSRGRYCSRPCMYARPR